MFDVVADHDGTSGQRVPESRQTKASAHLIYKVVD
jgi:hypothetical protein